VGDGLFLGALAINGVNNIFFLPGITHSVFFRPYSAGTSALQVHLRGDWRETRPASDASSTTARSGAFLALP
jgi:hypothetical protein